MASGSERATTPSSDATVDARIQGALADAPARHRASS
jgi:hypothetical protein